MIRNAARRFLILAAVLLIASAASVGAFALSEHDTLFAAGLSETPLEFVYTPPVNGRYALYLYSRDGNPVRADAHLYEDGAKIAEGHGSGELFDLRLTAGRAYTVRVSGAGAAMIEIARRAHSRCIADPMDVDEDYQGGKMIARAYDAHWYRFTAQADGTLAAVCIPETGDISMEGMITGADGALIARLDPLNGACLRTFEVRAGETYCVRLSSPGGGTGYYQLKLRRPGATDRNIAFARDRYAAAAGGTLDLSGQVSELPLLWRTDDEEIARVSQSGTVYALREGTAVVTAYGAYGSAECRVDIAFVPLAGIAAAQTEIELAAGDEARLRIRYEPENASDRRVVYRSDSPCAEVDESGTLRAIAEGEATVTAVSVDGGHTAAFHVTVTPAPVRYRALLVSQQNYPESVGEVRGGSETSVDALGSLLGTMRMDGGQIYAVRRERDPSRGEFIAAIRETFARAADGDVSLLYITCHGHYAGGMSFFEFTDGSEVCARDLERELRRIPGRIVVLIDCCASGGAIGSEWQDGVGAAFAQGPINGSRYFVICSAARDQDSYRIAFNDLAQAGVMTTAFVRALCDGAGWSVDLNDRGTMGADRDYSGSVSFAELSLYLKTRVNWYLQIASDLTGTEYAQTVQTYGEGDPLVIFKR